jgi:uroporphyrinogen decarboxylase
LIDILVEGTIDFLAAQMTAGAEAVQLFDSWAGVLPEPAFERLVIEPTKRVVSALKVRFPDCPIIGFPRGAGLLYERYITETGVDGIGLDTTLPAGYARAQLQELATVQGNLLCNSAAWP